MTSSADDKRRWHIINILIKVNEFTRYLELGSTGRLDAQQKNFDMIQVAGKFGVDTKGEPDFLGTTDKFFKEHIYCDIKFDLIFIDAQHHKAHVDRDIANSLEMLAQGGFIVVHDCNPFDKRCTVETLRDGYNGDVWKSIVELRATRNHLTVNTVDVDWGCAIIHKEWQDTPLDMKFSDCLDWYNFSQNYKHYLGLIDYREFLRRYGSGGYEHVTV